MNHLELSRKQICDAELVLCFYKIIPTLKDLLTVDITFLSKQTMETTEL